MRLRTALGLVAGIVLIGCQSGSNQSHGGGHSHGVDTSSATGWSDRFEVFAEFTPLVAERPSRAIVHVTRLSDFRALEEGIVSVALVDAAGSEQLFLRHEPSRAGVFEVRVTPKVAGDVEVRVRIQSEGATSEIALGEARVGTRDTPGRVLSSAVDGVEFLKETQWAIKFATDWVTEGEIRSSSRGVGHVRPAAGGELHLAAPVDGIVAADPWPYVGLARGPGETVLALTSRVSQGRTLAELQALDTAKRAALAVAKERLTRLEGLLDVGAVSQAEVEAARAQVETLTAQAESARRQMSSLQGDSQSRPTLEVAAPFAGEVAEVLVRPGQAVSAGDPVARMIRVQPVWIELQLSSADASRLTAGIHGLWARTTGAAEATFYGPDEVGLVSVAPEVSSTTGRVVSLLQVTTASARLRPGSAVEAEVVLQPAQNGVVVPTSAIVDDGGISVVFLQVAGETFERRPVFIVDREGERYLIEGVAVGKRLVTEGGEAIRRASLVSRGGAGHGHVH